MSDPESNEIDIEQARAKALELAFVATRILDDEYIENATIAIHENNKADFLAVCEEAGIPRDLAEDLWQIVGPSGKMIKRLPGGW
jgi:hypothetical protein